MDLAVGWCWQVMWNTKNNKKARDFWCTMWANPQSGMVSPSMFRECVPHFASSGTNLLLSFRTHLLNRAAKRIRYMSPVDIFAKKESRALREEHANAGWYIKTMVLVGVVCGFQTLRCLSPSKSCNWFVEALNPGDFIKEHFITGCSGLASDMPCHGAVWGPLGYGFYYLALPTSSYLPNHLGFRTRC